MRGGKLAVMKAKFLDIHVRVEILAGPSLNDQHWALEIVIPHEDLESLKSAKIIKNMMGSTFHYLTEKILRTVSIKQLKKKP